MTERDRFLLMDIHSLLKRMSGLYSAGYNQGLLAASGKKKDETGVTYKQYQASADKLINRALRLKARIQRRLNKKS